MLPRYKIFFLWLAIIVLALVEATLAPHGLDLARSVVDGWSPLGVVRLLTYLATMAWFGWLIVAAFRASNRLARRPDPGSPMSESPGPVAASALPAPPLATRKISEWTEELPLTSAHRAVLQRGRRFFLVILLGLALGSSTCGNETGRPGMGALIAILVCAPFVLLLVVSFVTQRYRTFLRTRGVIETRGSGGGSLLISVYLNSYLVLPDRTFRVDPTVVGRLPRRFEGIVEYSPDEQVVYEARDVLGKVYYRNPFYRPRS